MHVDEAGQFVGWVDWEDASTGPLLFDLACMCIGCCFRSEDNALDLDRLRAILEGYSSKRAITPSEVRRFIPFMRLTLLCNCEWRFRNFNIDHPEMEDNKDRCVRREGYGDACACACACACSFLCLWVGVFTDGMCVEASECMKEWQGRGGG